MIFRKRVEPVQEYAVSFGKWGLLGLFMGVIGGLLGAGFHHALHFVTHIRTENGWLIWLLPLGGLLSVGIQIGAGIFAAWGGKRTKNGWMTACQLMGMRHMLTGMKRQQIAEKLEYNPDFFFEMVPYALAMGAESGFAKRFGRRIMPQCGYLEAGRSEKRTAQEWAYLMRQTAEKLDNGAKRIKQYRR